MRRVLLIALAAAALASCGRPGKHEAAAPPAPQAKPAAAPDTAGPPPALPAWASGYLGKILPEAFPQTGECAGNTDGIKHRYAGPPRATQVVGWGWETAAKKRVERVLLTDESLRVVGAGQGGKKRPDVPRARPDIPDATTGWAGVANLAAGDVLAFGVIGEGRLVCPLGRIGL